MAIVKCVYCTEKIDKATAYRVPKPNKPTNFFYYCSEEEYGLYVKMEEEKLAEKEALHAEREALKEKKKIESQQRRELIDYIVFEFLDYQNGQPFPNVLNKELAKFTSFYTYPMIKESIVRSEETLRWAMDNTVADANEFGKIRYIMTIIEGNISQVYKEWTEKKVVKELPATHIDLINDIDMSTNVKKVNNDSILEFLGEDEL